MSIKLEIGKSYRVRNPEIVSENSNRTIIKIVDYKKELLYPFVGDDGFGYLEDGRFTFCSEFYKHLDLVEEVS